MSGDDKKLEQIKKADSLFSKKRLQEIENSMSDEDKKRYAKIGEEMYNSISFEDINSQGKLATENAEDIEERSIPHCRGVFDFPFNRHVESGRNELRFH